MVPGPRSQSWPQPRSLPIELGFWRGGPVSYSVEPARAFPLLSAPCVGHLGAKWGPGVPGRQLGTGNLGRDPPLERIVSLPSSPPHPGVWRAGSTHCIGKPTTSGGPHAPSSDGGEEASRCLDTPQSHPYCFPDSELVWKGSADLGPASCQVQAHRP